MWLAKLLSLIPTIVLGVERIHGDVKAGADKKKLALDALELAVSGATGVSPSDLKPAIAAAGGLASTVIDGTVSLFNKIGWPDNSSQQTAVPESVNQHWTRIK